MKTLQPSALRPFTICLRDLEWSDYFHGKDKVLTIQNLRTRLQSDGAPFKFTICGTHHGTIIIIDGEDITGEDLEASPEYKYLDSLLTR